VDLLSARSSLYDAVIELPKTPAVLELHVLPEGIPRAAQYEIRLLRIIDAGQRTELGVVSGLQPDTDGFLTVFVDPALLVPAQYELRIQDEKPASSRRTASFLIKVDPTSR
jgi:hypothetical protein